MNNCKHELKDLVGMADGIHCKACGAILDKLPEKPAAEKAEPKKLAPKKGGKTNARK